MNHSFLCFLHEYYSETSSQSLLDINYNKYRLLITNYSNSDSIIFSPKDNNDINFLELIFLVFAGFFSRLKNMKKSFSNLFYEYILKFSDFIAIELEIYSIIKNNVIIQEQKTRFLELLAVRVLKLLFEFETNISNNLKKEKILMIIQQMSIKLYEQLSNNVIYIKIPLFPKIKKQLYAFTQLLSKDYSKNILKEDLNTEESDNFPNKIDKSIGLQGFFTNNRKENSIQIDSHDESDFRLLVKDWNNIPMEENINDAEESPSKKKFIDKSSERSPKIGSRYQFSTLNMDSSIVKNEIYDGLLKNKKYEIKTKDGEINHKAIEINGVIFSDSKDIFQKIKDDDWSIFNIKDEDEDESFQNSVTSLKDSMTSIKIHKQHSKTLNLHSKIKKIDTIDNENVGGDISPAIARLSFLNKNYKERNENKKLSFKDEEKRDIPYLVIDEYLANEANLKNVAQLCTGERSKESVFCFELLRKNKIKRKKSPKNKIKNFRKSKLLWIKLKNIFSLFILIKKNLNIQINLYSFFNDKSKLIENFINKIQSEFTFFEVRKDKNSIFLKNRNSNFINKKKHKHDFYINLFGNENFFQK